MESKLLKHVIKLLKQNYYGQYIDLDSAKLVAPQTITAYPLLTMDAMDVAHFNGAGMKRTE